MGEGAATVAIAERPDARRAGAQFVVDDDVAARVGLDSGLVERQVVGVGPAPDREQHVGTRDFRRAGRAIEPDRDFGAPGFEMNAFRIQAHSDALGFENLP